MKSKSKITFFCALKYQDFKDSNHYYLFRNILLNSLEKNFRLSDIAEFIVACPENEISAIKGLFANSPIPHKVLDENEVCPEFRSISFGGYKKQMALKLAISNFVETDYYLIVDPDVVLLRKSSFDDIIMNGKPRLGLNTDCHYYHKFWLENAIESFCSNGAGNVSTPGKVIMGITPQVFITEIARKCVESVISTQGADGFISALVKVEESFRKRYEKTYKKNEMIQEQVKSLHEKGIEASNRGNAAYAQKISDAIFILHSRISNILLKLHHPWTEYTLYWAYILLNGLKDLYERDFSLYGNIYSAKKWALYTTEAIPDVNATELERDIVSGNVFGQEEPFVVIQSTAGHKIADLEPILQKYEVISK